MKLSTLLRRTLLGLTLAIGLEALLRGLDRFDPTAIEDPYMGFPGSSPIYRPIPRPGGEAWRETSPNRRNAYRTLEFPLAKGENELRVFCLGGSSVFQERFIDPDASFPYLLEVYLRGLAPTESPRVINSGGAGTGSIQNLQVAREVLGYQPDLLVLYPEGGEKNSIPPSPGGVLAHADRDNPARVWARRSLADLRCYVALREAFMGLMPRSSGAWVRSAFSGQVQQALAEPFSERTFTRLFEFKQDRVPVLMEQVIPEEEVRYANQRFLDNLREMARLCRERKVQLVLVLPLHNLRSSFYLRFHIDPDELLPGMEAEWRQRYERGLEAKRAGDHLAALKLLRSVRQCYREDRDDILGFYIAECFAALGYPNLELKELLRIYQRHPMLAHIRQVAEEFDLLLVDPLPDMIRRAGDRAPGGRFFLDAYHPSAEGGWVIARAIAKALARDGVGRTLAPWDSPTVQVAERFAEKRVVEVGMPLLCQINASLRAKDFEGALALLEQIPPEERESNTLYAFAFGWALTRSGREDQAKELHARLVERFGQGSGDLPDMSTDEGMVRHAFQGDVFAIF
jgi:hypothetical protein